MSDSPDDLGRVIANPGADETEIRFGYHKPVTNGYYNTPEMHADLRVEFRKFDRHLDIILPAGREKDIARERLEEVSMWSHKAIARLDPVVTE